MNEEIKTQWVEALRSGNYEQATGRMCRVIDRTADDLKYGYCCLGVLTDLYHKATNSGEWVADGRGIFAGKDFYDYNGEVFPASNDIPPGVRTWSDLLDDRTRLQLVTMNDGDRNTFIEIADWIEENL